MSTDDLAEKCYETVRERLEDPDIHTIVAKAGSYWEVNEFTRETFRLIVKTVMKGVEKTYAEAEDLQKCAGEDGRLEGGEEGRPDEGDQLGREEDGSDELLPMGVETGSLVGERSDDLGEPEASGGDPARRPGGGDLTEDEKRLIQEVVGQLYKIEKLLERIESATIE